ncbi:hypothetical protein N8926_01400 [Candidatus Pelagibacter sp.]|nr:hypothetical protein [Candidatus Pelagibacter sp.]
MKIKKELIKILFVFFVEEIKIFKNRVLYFVTFFNEIHIFKYFKSKINNKYAGDIFLNKDQNEAIALIKKFHSQKKIKISSKKKIFVESIINHPTYTIPNAYIARIVGNTLGRECCGILRWGDIKGKQIMNSFGINRIIYIHEGNFFSRLLNVFKAYNHMAKINNIKNLLKFKIDKIELGAAVYEQYIRFQKNPNLTKLNINLYYLLSRAITYNSQFKSIFRNEKNTFLVQSETQYFPFRISLQNSLKYKNKIISKRGISSIGIKIYEKFSERNENRNKIPKKLFNLFYKNLNKKNHNLIIKKFKEYHSIQFGKDTYQLLDDKNKNLYKILAKKDLCSYFNWDIKKPIVLILAHELSDGNLNNKWNLFQNDMFWIVETIKKISTLKSVNWLIKPHPSENIYNAKINTKTIFRDYGNNNFNIRLLPDNLNINNLISSFKAAITSHGTAGYEFPSFGVPTIICGDTPYSELGFNIEPKTKSQYFKLLEKIEFLKKVENEKIKKSQFFMYLFHHLTQAEIPILYESNIRMNYNKKQFWKNSLSLIKKYKLNESTFSKSLEFQLKSKNSVLVNLEKFKSFSKTR